MARLYNHFVVQALAWTYAAGFQQQALQGRFRASRGRGYAALPISEAVDVATLAGPVSSTTLLSFADQGQNLAGKFFQLSLPPYLGFLYFLSYPKSAAPPLVRFGFSYLLLFVLATIPTGIISKSTWGVSLADCDWLHGSAESLLTVTNVLLVLGFRRGLRGDLSDDNVARLAAGACAVGAALIVATGIPLLHLEAHDAFLGGLGDLTLASNEPANALSIPTWCVHFSSVAEFVVALGLAAEYARATGNPKWRGFAVAMLPSHASGVCACVYHLFYNQPAMAWLVTAQAGLTFLGNCTLFIAALRLALEAGWTPQTAFEQPQDAAPVVKPGPIEPQSDILLFAEVAAFAVVAAYATKYASFAALDFLQTPHDLLAAFIVVALPIGVATFQLANDDSSSGAAPAN